MPDYFVAIEMSQVLSASNDLFQGVEVHSVKALLRSVRRTEWLHAWHRRLGLMLLVNRPLA